MAEDEEFIGLNRSSAQKLEKMARLVLQRPPQVHHRRHRPTDVVISSAKGPPFRNDTGAKILPYAILIDAGTALDSDSEPVTDGDDPVISAISVGTTFSRAFVFSGNETIESDDKEIHYAQEGPYVTVGYDTGEPAIDDGFGVKPNLGTASKGFAGNLTCRGILDETNKYALFYYDRIETLLVKTTAYVAANSSTTSYKIYAGAAGSEADSGFTTVPSAYSRVSIASGAWATITIIDGVWYMSPKVPGVFPVTMSQSGGSDGSSTSPASWNYTVTDFFSSASLGTSLDPTASPHKFQRPSVGKMLKATFGLGFMDGSTFKLAWCNETPDAEAC